MIGPKDVENVLHITPVISTDMMNAMELWEDMYTGKSPWLHNPTPDDPVEIRSLGLPSMIASEKARMAVLELKSKITIRGDVNNSEEDDRIDWLNKEYKDKILSKLRNQLEYGEFSGGFVIKPYIVFKPVDSEEVSNDDTIHNQSLQPSLEVEFINQGSYFPLAYESSGKITEAAFIQTRVDKDYIYRRLEYHKLESNSITIINKAFKSVNKQVRNAQSINSYQQNLGDEIPLNSVPEWSNLQEMIKIKNVDRLLFAYYKCPEANTIDPLSPLGMSAYGRAVDLIKQADLQYSRILWEYQATEAAIDIDRDALLTGMDSNGKTYIKPNLMQQRLYRKLDLGESDTYKPFLPQIRDQSLYNGLNKLLMHIEDVCALSRGTLSDTASSEARTATELKILKQRSFSANQDIQQALQKTLEDVIYIFNIYADLYEINESENEYEVSFEWDDSILVDTDTELNQRLRLLEKGIISKLELRKWYFGETEDQANEALSQVGKETDEEDEREFKNQNRFTSFEGTD